jgi:hypothetical protein
VEDSLLGVLILSSVYNTTLRSIVPLPDPQAPPGSSWHPSQLEDLPRGSSVLGLYPDTTVFYQAQVISAPIPGTGMGLGVRGGTGRPDPGAVKGSYRLAFVEDGDNVHTVDKYRVIKVSPSQQRLFDLLGSASLQDSERLFPLARHKALRLLNTWLTDAVHGLIGYEWERCC